MTKLFLISVTLLLLPCIAFTQNNLSPKRIYNTKRIEKEAPLIDGMIDQDIWDIVEWSGDFIERYPNDSVEPSQQTKELFLYIKEDRSIYKLRSMDSLNQNTRRKPLSDLVSQLLQIQRHLLAAQQQVDQDIDMIKEYYS